MAFFITYSKQHTGTQVEEELDDIRRQLLVDFCLRDLPILAACSVISKRLGCNPKFVYTPNRRENARHEKVA